MAFMHTVSWSRIPSAAVEPVTADGVIVAIGSAPTHRLPGNGLGAMVNSMVLGDSLETATSELGYSSNFASYDLCEVMKVGYMLYGISPIIFINVLDPTLHKTVVAPASFPIASGQIVFLDDIIYDTVVVKNSAGSTTYVLNVDYTLSWTVSTGPGGAGENLVLTVLSSGTIGSATSLQIGYSKINPAAVTASSIEGAFNPATEHYTGIQMLPLLYPTFALVPGYLICPNWSKNTGVAAAMDSAVNQVDGRFRCKCIIDIDTLVATAPSLINTIKNTDNFVSKNQLVCWPMVGLAGEKFHLGTHIAAVSKQIDATHNGIPFDSPSNTKLEMDSLILADGTLVNLTETRANYINSLGVVTARNESGWISWGNLLACYPSNTDPADMWIPVSRMFDYVGNSLAITLRQKLDRPGNRALIEQITDTQQWWLNSLLAVGALISGTVEFRRTENPDIELANGHYKFHLMILPPTPAQWIELVLEFDFSGYANLFTATPTAAAA